MSYAKQLNRAKSFENDAFCSAVNNLTLTVFHEPDPANDVVAWISYPGLPSHPQHDLMALLRQRAQVLEHQGIRDPSVMPMLLVVHQLEIV